MTPISKALNLLLIVLIATSLFVPTVAATYEIDDGSTSTITLEEAIKYRIEHGYLTQITIEGVGYRYDENAKVWNIYTDKTNFFTFCADNDTKRMKLLDFMQVVDNQVRADGGGPVMGGMLLVFGGVLCIILCPLAPALSAPALVVPAIIAGGEGIATGFITMCTGLYDLGCRALAEELRSLK